EVGGRIRDAARAHLLIDQLKQRGHLRVAERESAPAQEQRAPVLQPDVLPLPGPPGPGVLRSVPAHAHRDATRRGAVCETCDAVSSGSVNRATAALSLSARRPSEPIDAAVCFVFDAVFRETDDISFIDLATCSEPRACCCAASEIAWISSASRFETPWICVS